MRKTYQITEYGSFVRESEISGYISLPRKTFDALETFVLSNGNKETDALEIMGVSAKKGIGKIITAKNYVGVVVLKDETIIEILPKIYSEEQVTDGKIKKLLVDMLKTLRNSPYKSLQTANLDIEKMNILDVFIRMFIEEVFLIVKRGLKCGYETVQSNGTVFKGKMNFAGQIKHNYAHKEYCFVEFDDFNANCAENKLLKATLLYLYRNTGSSRNKNDIKILLNSFVNIDTSIDYDGDFSKVVRDRNTNDYVNALRWSKVFLKGKSFTSFSGSEVAFALLFPMETLFENYITAQLRMLLDTAEYSISAQDRIYHLFEEPSRKFLIKPDIVVRNKKNKMAYIIDTKWKLLSDTKQNYGISQADMYQMYAYQKKYSSQNVTLIYPLTERISSEKFIEFYSQDGAKVQIGFVDMYDVKHSLSHIVKKLIFQEEVRYCTESIAKA